MKASGKRKRISKPQEERLIDLLDASAVVFAKDGVADAKIEDITAQANVSKGTFYLYFKSKDEAAAAVWRRYIDEFISVGESILTDDRVLAGTRLVRIFESLLRFTFANADLHRNLYQAAGAEAVKSAANQRLIELIGRTAQQGVDSGELECDQPELAASILYHGLCGATLDVLRMRPPRPDPLIKAGGRLAHTIFAKRKTSEAVAAKRDPVRSRTLKTASR
jgi:AcrR family transcriptional regulator